MTVQAPFKNPFSNSVSIPLSVEIYDTERTFFPNSPSLNKMVVVCMLKSCSQANISL